MRSSPLALQLKADPSQLVQAVAEAKGALDGLTGAAANTNTALEAIGKGVGSDAMTAFAQQGSADLLQFNTTLAQTQTAASEVFGAVSGAFAKAAASLPQLTGAQMAEQAASEAQLAALAQLNSQFEALEARVNPASDGSSRSIWRCRG